MQGPAGRPNGQDSIQFAQMTQRRRPRKVFRLVDEVLAQRQGHGDVQHAGPGQREGIVDQLGAIGRTESVWSIGQHAN